MSGNPLLDYLHMECVELFKQNNPDNVSFLSKLENIGFDVGFRFVEKFTREWSRFKEELDIIKFICMDFWLAIFGKKADTLRTNKNGIYVLIDNSFRWVVRMTDSKQYIELTPELLALPCGLIRGALCNLGINSVVTADVYTPPTVEFTINIQPHS